MPASPLDPRTTAIVTIDLQQGIAGGPAGRPAAVQEVVTNAARLLRAGRRAGAQLVRVGAAADGADWFVPQADAAMGGPGGKPPDWSAFIPELEHQHGDVAILKRQWGAFYGTDLELQLRRRGIATLVLCGIATEYGVESTARDAFERGFEQVLVADAMTGVTTQSHDNALQQIFPRLGRVRDTDWVVDALGG